MATNYNITMKQFNGTDYDNLYPAANLANSIGTLGVAHGGTGVTSISALQTQLGLDQYAKIQTGSYTGTGTYGISNPNSLTFNITPHFCFIGGYNYQTMFNFVTVNNKYGYTYFADGHGGELEISIGAINYENISNQIQWFFDSPGVVFQITPSVATGEINVSDNSSAGAYYQLNVNTRNYVYLII